MTGGQPMTDDAVREHYRVLLQLIIEKNPQFIEAIRRNPMMEDVLMEIVKDRVDEKVNAKEQQTTVTHINDIMTKLKYTAEQAMELAGLWKDHGNELTVEETVRDMRKGRSFDH